MAHFDQSDYERYEFICRYIPGGFLVQDDSKEVHYKFVSKGFADMLGYTVEEFMEASKGTPDNFVDCLGHEEEFDEFNANCMVGEEFIMVYKIRCKDGSWKLVEDRGTKVINDKGETEFWSVVIDIDEREKLQKAEVELHHVNQLMEEQEAHLEEIKTLNMELEERQTQLEELTSEQEAHIEEVTALNDSLEDARHAAEAANEAKTTFLNNMSHDIRTPMNAILGFTKLIERDINDPEKIAVSLKKINNSSNYLLNIINNVLDMARIESGKVSLNLDFLDLRDPNANILTVFEEEFRKKNIKHTFDIAIEHRYVLVDIAKTNEIVVNLVSNAIKYTPVGGSVAIRMKELPCARPGYATYCWSITDTGIGMSKEFQATIFDAFTREKNTTQSKIAGTGLGMAIVKKLVDFLGGTIEVESEPGQGTTFRVLLEHKLVDKPEDYIKNQEEHIPEDINFRGRHILLAEDNDLNAEIAIAILEDEGFIVERAEDGVACVEKLNNATVGYYDVILMDIQMPYLDGYGATVKIRQLTDKGKANIPILAMTANAFEEDKRKALAAGMDGFCTKPIEIEQLNKELARVLN